MKLRKEQKEAVLTWVAEGLRSDEINLLAAKFEPPFSVSRRQVEHYRKTRKVDIEAIVKAGEHKALSEGLARVARRVENLKKLACRLEKDLLGGDVLWLPQVKSIGSGKAAQVVEYEEFNRAEIEAYRGLLDDIARELGHRQQQIDATISFDSAEWRRKAQERRQRIEQMEKPECGTPDG